MKGHPLTTEPPLLMFGDMSGGSSNRKDGQKMTYRDDNPSSTNQNARSVTNRRVAPLDAMLIGVGATALAAFGVALIVDVYPTLAPHMLASLLGILEQAGAGILIVVGLTLAGGAR